MPTRLVRNQRKDRNVIVKNPVSGNIPDDANLAPNWWSCVRRGFIRAWPLQMQSDKDQQISATFRHT